MQSRILKLFLGSVVVTLLIFGGIQTTLGSTETLLLFDDFDGTSLNLALWQTGRRGSYSVSGGFLNLFSDTDVGTGAFVRSNDTFAVG